MKNIKLTKGFGLVEIIVAVGIWVIFASVGVVSTLGSLRLNRLGGEQTEASLLASEGIDAVHSIRKQGWASPFLATNCTAGCGLTQTSGVWAFSGSSNLIDNLTRKVFVTQAQRNVSGDIVDSGGTADSDTYKVVSEVSWSRGTPPITNTVQLTSYLTNFTKAIVTGMTGGFLVYGDGTTTPKYRTYDRSANTYSAEQNGVVGAAGRSWQMRTSPTKTEAVAGYITSGGVLQIMCFDGSTWTNDWSVTVGGTGTTSRFDIAYETNSGDAIVLYSTNTGTTNELAYRTKLGSNNCGAANWGAATNLDPV